MNRKQFKELSHLRVAQELDAHEGLIWAMQFSRNGDYLASGGEDEVSGWRRRCSPRCSPLPRSPSDARNGAGRQGVGSRQSPCETQPPAECHSAGGGHRR